MTSNTSEIADEERLFSIAVLHLAKKIYGDSAKYLQATRMVKLVALVADNVEYNLTKGWYKYGYYAPSTYDVVRKFAGKDTCSLLSFEPPSSMIDLAFEKFSKDTTDIQRIVDKLGEFFIIKWDDFIDWVYRWLTPEKYRNFYLTHVEFLNFLKIFQHYLKNPEVWKSQFDKFGARIESLVTKYHGNLEHVDNVATLTLFYDFMDLLEMVGLRMENKQYAVEQDELSFLGDLTNFYIRQAGYELLMEDLWMLLVPYDKTLSGPLAETERSNHARKVKGAREYLERYLSQLFRKAKNLDLLPSIEELDIKIKKLDKKYPDRRSLREVYSHL